MPDDHDDFEPGCDIDVAVMGQRFQLPADKWTTVVIVSILAVVIVCCTYIVFVAASDPASRGFWGLLGQKDRETAAIRMVEEKLGVNGDHEKMVPVRTGP